MGYFREEMLIRTNDILNSICKTHFETMVTILKQKKMQVQLMRMRYQNQRNT